MMASGKCVVFSQGAVKLMKQHCISPSSFSVLSKRFVDVKDVMDFIDDDGQTRQALKRQTIPLIFPNSPNVRDYQWESARKLCKKNGFLISPCGSGKTLIGLLIAALNGGNFLVLTTRYAEQWISCLNHFFSFMGNVHIHHYGTSSLPPLFTKTCVIATYSSFSRSTSCTRKRYLKQQTYSTVLLDESHYAASEMYMKLVQDLRKRTRYMCALTATKVREDRELEKLEKIIGSDSHTVQRQILVGHGYVLDVFCSNLIVKYDDAIEDIVNKKTSLCIHPFKMRLLTNVSKKLLLNGHKIIVFCDDLFCIRWSRDILSKTLKVDGSITMHTPMDVRQKIIQTFSASSTPSILFLSRTGDEALDVPIASACIVFCNNWASRRQIVQRIGRITRVWTGPPPQFIVILSDEEDELRVSTHREVYMREHGFVINQIRQEDSHFCVETTDQDHTSYREQLAAAIQKADFSIQTKTEVGHKHPRRPLLNQKKKIK